MNLLDRAIGWWNPAAGVERAMQRQLLQDISARGYASGSKGRQGAGWIPTGSMPDEVLAASSGLILNRARDMGRNSPWGASALRRLPVAMVGTGVVASIQIEGQRARKAVQDDWDAFREEGNGLGREGWDPSLSLLLRTVVEAGDALIVWENAPSSARLRVPLRWRMLTPDYIDRARMTGALTGHSITQGIEVDGDGRAVAVWLYERHPSDTLLGLPVSSRRYDLDQVDIIMEPLWLHQRRGVPWLSPVAMTADELQQYETAALWKARMAASFGIIRKGGAGAQSSLAGASGQPKAPPQTRFSPGMEVHAAQGEEITSLAPPRDDNFQIFWNARLYAMAAGLGLPFASLTGDLRGANYSSLREGKLLFWELLDHWQWNMVHDQVLRSVWRRFGMARFAAGRTTGGLLPPVKWGFPKRPWVDPLKDVAALEREMDLGLTTWPDAVAARGEDAEAQLAEMVSWGDRLSEAGFPLGRGRISREAAEASGRMMSEAAKQDAAGKTPAE